jgi:hypothetical protein
MATLELMAEHPLVVHCQMVDGLYQFKLRPGERFSACISGTATQVTIMVPVSGCETAEVHPVEPADDLGLFKPFFARSADPSNDAPA